MVVAARSGWGNVRDVDEAKGGGVLEQEAEQIPLFEEALAAFVPKRPGPTIRNQQVVGSSPTAGSTILKTIPSRWVRRTDSGKACNKKECREATAPPVQGG